MEITPTYVVLVGLLVLVTGLSFANALIVKQHGVLRFVILMFSVGAFNVTLYYVGAGIGLIDGESLLARNVFRLSWIIALSFLVPVFGVPLFLHWARTRDKSKHD